MDLGTGKTQALQLTASSGLDEGQIETLIGEAEEHKEKDRQRREFIDLRNKADGLVYSTERTLVEFSDSVSAADRDSVEKQLEATRIAMDGDDTGGLRAAVDELMALTYKMTEDLYAEIGADEAE
jgi:molecular chaperone DnaK